MGVLKVGDKLRTKRSSPSDAVDPATAAAEQIEPQDAIATIREILVGAQLGESERELVRLREFVEQQLAELRRDLQGQIGLLERQLQNEVGVLVSQVKGERNARSSAQEGLERELGRLSGAVEERFQTLEARSEESIGGLRELVLSHTTQVSATMQKQHQEATRMISDGLREVRSAKTDRTTLARLLEDVAHRLEGEGKA